MTIESERNGRIVVKRWFGKSEIEVDGYVQSGDYMRCLWSEALWRANSNPSVKSVLMLGLGCGSAVDVVQNRFPGCVITAVEWDSIMIELAHRFGWFKPASKVEIVCGDAFKILPEMMQRFDLILSDLFRGDVLESRLTTPQMVGAIAQVMTPNGQFIVNAFKDSEVFETLAKHLDFVQHWRFRNNHLGLFQLLVPKLDLGRSLTRQQP